MKSPPGNGPYCLRIHGHIYHLVSRLNPNEANKPGHRRLYISDSAETSNKTAWKPTKPRVFGPSIAKGCFYKSTHFLSNVKNTSTEIYKQIKEFIFNNILCLLEWRMLRLVQLVYFISSGQCSLFSRHLLKLRKKRKTYQSSYGPFECESSSAYVEAI
jgi:hypothetical protein